MRDAAEQFLYAEGLVSGYGKRQVLHGVGLNVCRGELVAIIGHNGAGKSTLLRTIFGLLPAWEGRVMLDGQLLKSTPLRDMQRAGVAYVPQGNRVFTDLSVRENLQLGGATLRSQARLREGIEFALSTFPALRNRLRQRAGTLSGGEKQMLALANALIIMPRLLLLDEPSLGLAPPLVTAALSQLARIKRDAAVAMLVAEQKVREILKYADRVYALRSGRVSFEGAASLLKNEDSLRRAYL